MLGLLVVGACSAEDTGETAQPVSGGLPPLTMAPTTLERTLVPQDARLSTPGPENPALPDGLLSYGEGFGALKPGPGEPAQVRTIDGTEAPPPGPNARRLSRFVHLADLQIADDESPMRLASFDGSGPTGPALRPQDWYLCAMGNAAVRTINFLHRKEAIDFVLLGGDNADSAQSNELDWVMTVLNGGPLECDSGEDDDPIPGPGNDGKDKLVAEGLQMPWKWVTGNHDILIQGNAALTEQRKQNALGTVASGGTRDFRQNGALTKSDVIPDPRRALLERTEVMSRVADDRDGHGMGDAQRTSGKAFYHFDVEGSPLRFVILDTGAETGGAEGMLHQADVDAHVKPALDEAKALGKLVILASHHASAALTKEGGTFGQEQEDAVLPEAWRSFLGQYDNVLFSMVAHSHENKVEAISSPQGHRWWEVMTAAIADYPHQFRVIEVWDQDNGWIALRGTCVDLATEGDPVAAEGLRRGTVDMLVGWSPDGRGPVEQRNVELLIKKPGG